MYEVEITQCNSKVAFSVVSMGCTLQTGQTAKEKKAGETRKAASGRNGGWVGITRPPQHNTQSSCVRCVDTSAGWHMWLMGFSRKRESDRESNKVTTAFVQEQQQQQQHSVSLPCNTSQNSLNTATMRHAIHDTRQTGGCDLSWKI
ncbi:unnamed protein product, partial [Ectocarpus sp. 12 AP-2014]